MFDKILVVCTGNICRSPFAEHMLQTLCPTRTVHSAGTHALSNHKADDTATKVAHSYGINLKNHQGQQISERLCQHYDLILTMEREHMRYISQISPVSTGKIMLYGQWLDEKTIHDPYKKSEDYFKLIFDKIERAAKLWKDRL